MRLALVFLLLFDGFEVLRVLDCMKRFDDDGGLV